MQLRRARKQKSVATLLAMWLADLTWAPLLAKLPVTSVAIMAACENRFKDSAMDNYKFFQLRPMAK
jgi:hypothetical protein